MRRYLPILALLALSLPLFSQAQSLGDLARDTRAERLNSGHPPAKVFTNEDITRDVANVNTAEPEKVAPAETPTNISTNASEALELERQQRSAEINKQYLDRIATLRDQIDAAKRELAKLQNDEIDIADEYRREMAANPYTGYFKRDITAYYNTQMRACTDAIAALNSQITSLNVQLADVQEAARHAGVPHATD